MSQTSKPRQCFFIPIEQFDENGYVPSLVTEGEPGHSPLKGDPAKLQAAWYWGKTYEAAKAHCAKENARLGLSEDDVTAIVCSSMGATRRPRAAGAVRILSDQDCPGCGWPECVAVGSFETGPERLECAARVPCGWSAPVVQA